MTNKCFLINNLHYLWNELTARPNTKKQNMIIKMIVMYSEMHSTPFDGAIIAFNYDN